MKAHFGLPTGTYSLGLKPEELEILKERGHLHIQLSHVPCSTSRAMWNRDTEDVEVVEEKEIENYLAFYEPEAVADLDKGYWHVQFLNIIIDEKEEG